MQSISEKWEELKRKVRADVDQLDADYPESSAFTILDRARAEEYCDHEPPATRAELLNRELAYGTLRIGTEGTRRNLELTRSLPSFFRR